MCGIAGYWGTGEREVLDRMKETLRHRGPDEQGSCMVDTVGLAHTRLSILDLSPTGRQPMEDREGTVTLVFNGEIYNYRELRTEYLSECNFVGSSDTEVLIHLYKKFGVSFLEKIRGMFALALYDRNTKSLLLARDHLGKKPLYWAQTQSGLIFGSELKALRAHPECPREVSRTSIAQYLVYEFIPAPATIYEGIYKLLPGTYLTYDGTTSIEKAFSTLEAHQPEDGGQLGEKKDTLFGLLEAAVAKRMVADVPVGIFLSGGLDSSTVAFFAQRAQMERVKTFSIGFEDASFDESSYASEVARMLGTEHHERTVTAHDLQQMIERLPEVLDEPMADSSIIPTLLLSEFARKEVKVALGGDGADELFWGYGTFLAHRVGHVYEKTPKAVMQGIEQVLGRLPVSHGYMSLDFKIKKFLSGFHTSRERRNAYWLSAFTPNELTSILNYDVPESIVLQSTDALYRTQDNFWDALQMEYIHGFLTEDILVKSDRASMAYGLEVRSPFLDLDIVHFALTLSREYKYRGLTSKYLVKETMKGHLPEHITHRSKKGFNIPIGAWIRGDLKELFTDTLLDGALVTSGLFKREGLVILLEAHISGKKDHRKKLWALLVLELWMKKWHE